MQMTCRIIHAPRHDHVFRAESAEVLRSIDQAEAMETYRRPACCWSTGWRESTENRGWVLSEGHTLAISESRVAF